jgi:hypothetical protein
MVRNLIGTSLLSSEISPVKGKKKLPAESHPVANLMFGEYVKILQDPILWRKLNLTIDREAFCGELDLVRKIRNDVMHFDPEGITPGDLEKLRSFSTFMKELERLRSSVN